MIPSSISCINNTSFKVSLMKDVAPFIICNAFFDSVKKSEKENDDNYEMIDNNHIYDYNYDSKHIYI